MTTTAFAGLTERCAAQFGAARLRTIVLGHPIGGQDEATLRSWSDDAVEPALGLFTGISPAKSPPPPVPGPARTTSTALGSAVEEIRALIAADGGDMLMISADSAVLDLALVIHGARCAECVMPREHLERIALGIVERHVSGFTAVHIEDPREQPGWSPETPNPSDLGGVQ